MNFEELKRAQQSPVIQNEPAMHAFDSEKADIARIRTRVLAQSTPAGSKEAKSNA